MSSVSAEKEKDKSLDGKLPSTRKRRAEEKEDDRVEHKKEMDEEMTDRECSIFVLNGSKGDESTHEGNKAVQSTMKAENYDTKESATPMIAIVAADGDSEGVGKDLNDLSNSHKSPSKEAGLNEDGEITIPPSIVVNHSSRETGGDADGKKSTTSAVLMIGESSEEAKKEGSQVLISNELSINANAQSKEAGILEDVETINSSSIVTKHVIDSISNTQDSFELDTYPVRTREEVIKREDEIRCRREEEIASIKEKIKGGYQKLSAAGHPIVNHYEGLQKGIMKKLSIARDAVKQVNSKIEAVDARRNNDKEAFNNLCKEYEEAYAELKRIDPEGHHPDLVPFPRFPAVIHRVKSSGVKKYKIVQP